MVQSGHVVLDTPIWEMVTADSMRDPVIPVLDGEPNYEDLPVDPFLRIWPVEFGLYSEYDVRKQAYRAVFAGTCGHTYGHHAVWQFWTLHCDGSNFPVPTWDEAILRPGATHLRHIKQLILSRSYLSRIPGQTMLLDVPEIPPLDTSKHGNVVRAAHPRSTRCAAGSYGMVYFPQAHQSLEVDVRRLAGRVNAWWYDPRTGTSHAAGEHLQEPVVFTSPHGRSG